MQVERIYAQKCVNGGSCLAMHVSSINECGHTMDARFHLMMPLFPLWFVRWAAKTNARFDGVTFMADRDWHEQT